MASLTPTWFIAPPVMFVLAGIAVAALTIVIAKLWQFRALTRSAAIHRTSESPGALRSGLRPLEVIAFAAPLVGAAGTVLGLFDAFGRLDQPGARIDPAGMAGGALASVGDDGRGFGRRHPRLRGPQLAGAPGRPPGSGDGEHRRPWLPGRTCPWPREKPGRRRRADDDPGEKCWLTGSDDGAAGDLRPWDLADTAGTGGSLCRSCRFGSRYELSIATRRRRPSMQRRTDFYINGEWVPPATPHDFEVIDPADESPFAVISLGTKADLDKAVAAARTAFDGWSPDRAGGAARPAGDPCGDLRAPQPGDGRRHIHRDGRAEEARGQCAGSSRAQSHQGLHPRDQGLPVRASVQR